MPEKDIKQATTEKLMELADVANESFVLAVIAAYRTGVEKGRKEAAA